MTWTHLPLAAASDIPNAWGWSLLAVLFAGSLGTAILIFVTLKILGK